MGDNFEIFSNNLKKLRKLYNMKQNELAQKIGVSKSVISYYESGQSEPTLSILSKIAAVFKISTDTLISLEINENLESIDVEINKNLNEKFLNELYKLKGNYLEELERVQKLANIEIPKKIREIQNLIDIIELNNN